MVNPSFIIGVGMQKIIKNGQREVLFLYDVIDPLHLCSL